MPARVSPRLFHMAILPRFTAPLGSIVDGLEGPHRSANIVETLVSKGDLSVSSQISRTRVYPANFTGSANFWITRQPHQSFRKPKVVRCQKSHDEPAVVHRSLPHHLQVGGGRDGDCLPSHRHQAES